ncbi:MAG: restriction endonuclease subunit S [Rhodospirillaceae bacterium]
MSVWPLKSLDELFEIARGGSPRPIDAFITDEADGVNWIMIGDASASSKFIRQTKKKIRPSGVSKSRLVKPGDFLLTNSMSFGRPYILDTHGCIHDGWLVLSPKANNLDQGYFYHLLGSPSVFQEFSRLAAGATVKNLNIDLVKSVKVALPPLAEQKRIAAILDQADELRRKRQRATDRLNQLGQAIFYEMFGDLAGKPRATAFSDIAEIQQSLVDPKQDAHRHKLHISPEHIVGGLGAINWRMVKTAAEDGIISGKNEFNENAVLYSKIRPYLNKVALPDRRGICSADMYVIRPKFEKANKWFLKAVLMGDDFLTYAASFSNRANIPKLNRKQVEAYKFFCPSVADQDVYAERIKTIEDQGRLFLSAGRLADDLFSSIESRAFRGEL